MVADNIKDTSAEPNEMIVFKRPVKILQENSGMLKIRTYDPLFMGVLIEALTKGTALYDTEGIWGFTYTKKGDAKVYSRIPLVVVEPDIAYVSSTYNRKMHEKEISIYAIVKSNKRKDRNLMYVYDRLLKFSQGKTLLAEILNAYMERKTI